MIRLEKLTAETAQIMRKWRNHDHRYFRDKNLITYKQQEEWFKKYLKDLSYWFFIVYRYDEPVGCIGFSVNQNNFKEAHIESVILGEKKYARQGMMSEALKLALDVFPFEAYTLTVLKDNATAIAFYKKHGFAVAKEEDSCYIMKRSDGIY